jgi:hypothetical protein
VKVGVDHKARPSLLAGAEPQRRRTVAA